MHLTRFDYTSVTCAAHANLQEQARVHVAAAGQNASSRGSTALVQMKNDSQTCDRRPTADGMLLAYSPFGAAIESRRPLLRPPHRHPRPPTSQGDPARADAALPRRCGGASALAHSLAHSLRVATLRSAAAGLIVAALTVPGTAQTKGLTMKPVSTVQNPKVKDAILLTSDEIRARGPTSKVILYRNELQTSGGVFIYEIVEGAASCSLDTCPGALGFKKTGEATVRRIVDGNWDYGDTAPRISKDFKTLSIGSSQISLGSHQQRQMETRPCSATSLAHP